MKTTWTVNRFGRFNCPYVWSLKIMGLQLSVEYAFSCFGSSCGDQQAQEIR